MTNQRRYGEAEVAEIFQYAASPHVSDGHAPASERGFSLAELQSIGAEVGIAPERVAEAAAALDVHRVEAPRRRTHLGMPVAVGRTVDLPRAPTDREWEMLLADLRETFGARGKDRSSGGVRTWTNGNLHAHVEPTETGYRLRLGTSKGTAVAASQMGLASLFAGLVLSVLLFAEVLDEDLVVLLVFSLMGAIALAMNAIRLPRWADVREEQMERIAARARVLIA
jgi:hypothetical protein